MRGVLLALLVFVSAAANAADSLRVLSQRPMSARYLTTDELGNIYVVHANNTLARYNDHCDSTGFYRSALNGNLGLVDATNPLRVLLYYPAFNKVQLLDRQLALKAEIDLRSLRILSPTAVATASDGNFWCYDPLNARILKLDESGSQVAQSIDLRQQLSFVPRASFMLERNRRLYLCDTTQGILVFDQFATYVTTLPFKSISTFQAFDQQILFEHDGTLHSYDMQRFDEKLLPLPLKKDEAIVSASLTTKCLAVLYSGTLVLFTWPNK